MLNRPKVHYTPPKNWCNDPNGLCYFNGEYHLFYQYFPYGLEWGTMHWGHATTKNFIDYITHDIALFPSIEEDMNGVFSGSAYIDENGMNIFYTGVKYCSVDKSNIHIPAPQNNFISSQIKITSKDGFNFDCKEKKVIIPIEYDKEIAHPVHTRDPKIWKHNEKYYMIIATKLENEKVEQGKLNIYESDDLDNFRYFTSYTRENFGNMWECPDFFVIDNKQFVIMSPENFMENKTYPSQAIIQKAMLDYEKGSLKLSNEFELLDYGYDLYAPQTFEDSDGSRIMFSWIRMPKPFDEEKPYIGAFTMPRVISYKNNQIVYNVHKQLKQQFKVCEYFSKKKVNLLKVMISKGESINIGGYIINYDGALKTDRTEVYPNLDVAKCSSPKIDKNTVSLEIYVDQNIIEIFIDEGRYVITNVIYDMSNVFITNCNNITFLTI